MRLNNLPSPMLQTLAVLTLIIPLISCQSSTRQPHSAMSTGAIEGQCHSEEYATCSNMARRKLCRRVVGNGEDWYTSDLVTKWYKGRAHSVFLKVTNGMLGRATYLGDGWFLTAEHVLTEPGERLQYNEEVEILKELEDPAVIPPSTKDKFYPNPLFPYTESTVSGMQVLSREANIKFETLPLQVNPSIRRTKLKFSADVEVYVPKPAGYRFTKYDATGERWVVSLRPDIAVFRIKPETIIGDGSLFVEIGRENILDTLDSLPKPKVSLAPLAKSEYLEATTFTDTHFVINNEVEVQFDVDNTMNHFFSFALFEQKIQCKLKPAMGSPMAAIHGLDELPQGIAAGQSSSGSGIIGFIDGEMVNRGVVITDGWYPSKEEDAEIIDGSREVPYKVLYFKSVNLNHPYVSKFLRKVLPAEFIQTRDQSKT